MKEFCFPNGVHVRESSSGGNLCSSMTSFVFTLNGIDEKSPARRPTIGTGWLYCICARVDWGFKNVLLHL